MIPFHHVRIRSERAVVGNSDTKANNPFGSCLHPDMLIRIKEGLFFARLVPLRTLNRLHKVAGVTFRNVLVQG